MGISSIRAQVAVVAASVAAAGWLSAATPAGATADGERQPAMGVSAGGGVCGWFSEEFPDRSEFVSVCGYDRLLASDPGAGDVPEPVVVVDRYTCFFDGGHACDGEHHEVVVDRRQFTLDPLLRRARIATPGTGGCAVEVEFAATSAGTPHGGISEYHGVAGGPWLTVFGSQTMTRPAEWWGRVCGRFVVAKGGTGAGEMWRDLTAGAGTVPAGGEGGEVA